MKLVSPAEYLQSRLYCLALSVLVCPCLSERAGFREPVSLAQINEINETPTWHPLDADAWKLHHPTSKRRLLYYNKKHSEPIPQFKNNINT